MDPNSSQLLLNTELNQSTVSRDGDSLVLRYFLEYMTVMKAGIEPKSSVDNEQLVMNKTSPENRKKASEKLNKNEEVSLPEKTSTVGTLVGKIAEECEVKSKAATQSGVVKKRRGSYRMYSLAFKLAAVNYATQHSRMAASKKLGVKYELIRMWCTQRDQLLEAASKPNGKRQTKVFTSIKKKPRARARNPVVHGLVGTENISGFEVLRSDQNEPSTFLSSTETNSKQYSHVSSENLSDKVLSPEDGTKKQAKQCTYSIKFKLEVAEYCERTGNKSATARKYGVDRKRVMDWLRDKDKLRQRLQEHIEQVPWEKEPTRLAGSGRRIISPTLEIRIISWIKELQRMGVKLSGQMICDKAMEYYRADENIQREQEMTHFSSFSASCGWLRSFLRRQNIKLNHALGEGDIPEDFEQLETVGLDNGQTWNVDGNISDDVLLRHLTVTQTEANQLPAQ